MQSPSPPLHTVLVPALAFVLGASSAGCSGSATTKRSELLHVENAKVVDGRGEPVWLRGVEFSNWIASTLEPSAGVPDPLTTHHDERDYERLAQMGVNLIRFYLDYKTFEDDAAPFQYKPEGFAWLDQNVEWARAHGIYLIPTLAVPPGGDQWPCGKNTLFWDVPENQDRAVALWRAIAERYAHEPALGAYGLIYEPLPSVSANQWQTLAGRLASAIREVDAEHMLVVERVNAVGCDFEVRPDFTFRVADPNVLYEADSAQPWDYTGQLLASTGLADRGAYPDETRLIIDSAKQSWQGYSIDSRPNVLALGLTPDETAWTEKRFSYTVTTPSYEFCVPTLVSKNNSGKVYFDDLVVEEYDQDLNFVRTVLDVDIENSAFWYLWQLDPAGGGVLGVGSDGHRGKASITLSGTTSDANLTDSLGEAFAVKLGYTYEVTGWMKGEHSAPNSASYISLAFYSYSEELPRWNKAGLLSTLADFVAWGHTEQVPIYVGWVATGAPTFENEKGGLHWVEDMLDIASENDLHLSYFAYHNSDFGIYRGDHGLPDPEHANQPLIDLLTRKLKR